MGGRRHCAYQSCPKLYEDYYNNQVGHGLPVFVGGRSIRGHGLGGLLAGIGRAVVPLLKKGGKALLKEGARTGLQAAHDVLSSSSSSSTSSRRRVGSALKQRSGRAVKRLLNQALGGGPRKRIKTSRPSGRKQNKPRRQQQQQQQRRRRRPQATADIFG